MKLDKAFILRNLITIFCVLCVIAPFFHFLNMSVNVESNFIGSSTQESFVDGWTVFSDYPLSWLLLIGPAVLVAMNYIKPLEKFKGLLAIFIPILCIAVLFLALSGVKAEAAAADDAVGAIGEFTDTVLGGMDLGTYTDFSAGAESSAGLGFYMFLIANVGIIISGAVTYFGLRLNDLSSVKESGKAILSSAREVAAVAREDSRLPTTEETAPAAEHAAPVARRAAPTPKKNNESVIKSSAEDALQLIERLAKMRDSGILTEEEFQEKKRDLLKGV